MKSKGNIYNYFGIPPPPGYNSESIVLESADIRHGDNCGSTGCRCTSVKDSQRFGDEFEKKIKQLHEGRFKGVRAQRAKKQQEKQQKQRQDGLALPEQDEPNLMEDYEPI